jgi:hypothetical protein
LNSQKLENLKFFQTKPNFENKNKIFNKLKKLNESFH